MQHMQRANTWITGSGLPWQSGAYTMFNEQPPGPAATQLFGAYRGRPCDIATTFPGYATWAEITSANELLDDWVDWPGTMAFAVGMIPSDGSTMAAGSAGTYNSHWTTFANTIKSYYPVFSTASMRLGWEFNDAPGYPWGGSTSTFAQEYAAYWRNIYNIVHPICPYLKWCWCVNRGKNALADPTEAWPGSQYVTYVGVDSYDRFNPFTVSGGSAGQFSSTSSGQGLNYWLNFATANSVQFSVPEWACWSLVPGNPDGGGGDDPAYIKGYIEFFQSTAAAGNMGFESMFQGQMPVPPIGTQPNTAGTYATLISAV